MPRKKRHYLNRYATPTQFDLEQVDPIAEIILDNSLTGADKLKAALEFTTLVRSAEDRQWAVYETRTAERLFLTNALECRLRDSRSKWPRYTAEMTLKIGVEMHLKPVNYDIASIAESISTQHPTLSYEHLLKMASHLVIEAENVEDVMLNERRCLRLAKRADQEKWSPKKLETEIKKDLGLRAGGRPRKAR